MDGVGASERLSSYTCWHADDRSDDGRFDMERLACGEAAVIVGVAVGGPQPYTVYLTFFDSVYS